ncbi:hydroxypyruvate isomerase [Singulisphaera sp. GP187]|uniref:hydroxypyruvate isomerase family protein n=1 Tax=Singulisphaera sp. GP187 TaxID=1882752 RepID=UPI0009270A09|nr:TIM barrel protein [Singulisphaera sp. GP187]SIO57961.1 hydroxypyruvate isomerase [Singulisphaera sp. GP187]
MNPENQNQADLDRSSRRQLLEGAALLGLASLGGATAASASASGAETKAGQAGARITKGRIKQSIVHWCFEKYWNVEAMIGIAKQLGCGSIELIAPEHFPLLKKHGLECAIASIDMGAEPPFVKGFNNPKYREQVLKATKDSIDACAAHGFKNVITFTGMAEGLPNDVGAANCVEGFKEIIGYAEKKQVTLCLEMLNTRDRSHPMKGHPGYQGNHTDYCIDIIKRVDSPNLKLLFDIYHVQIMDGDVIRRIREHKDYLGHIHTAGNPGRGELDDAQEIAFKPIMEALLEVGYQGYVGQEFIPVRDPLAGLEQAVVLCDV